MPIKYIRLALDEALLKALDRVAADLGVTRSAIVQSALAAAVRQHEVQQLELRDEAGYRAMPDSDMLYELWADEQVWGEGWETLAT